MTIEDDLYKAIYLLPREYGDPERLWYPGFGWMNLKTGEPKELIAAFYEFIKKKEPDPSAEMDEWFV